MGKNRYVEPDSYFPKEVQKMFDEKLIDEDAESKINLMYAKEKEMLEDCGGYQPIIETEDK